MALRVQPFFTQTNAKIYVTTLKSTVSSSNCTKKIEFHYVVYVTIHTQHTNTNTNTEHIVQRNAHHGGKV